MQRFFAVKEMLRNGLTKWIPKQVQNDSINAINKPCALNTGFVVLYNMSVWNCYTCGCDGANFAIKSAKLASFALNASATLS